MDVDIGYTTRHDLGTRALGILKALADHPDRGIDAWVVAEAKRMTAEWDATFYQSKTDEANEAALRG